MNPEFLREGSPIKDFCHTGSMVIGQLDKTSGDAIECIYKEVNALIFRTSLAIVEMIKYVSNTFHALKITFANEIGTLCKTAGIDGQQVMEIFCQDQQLNISPVYLNPDFLLGILFTEGCPSIGILGKGVGFGGPHVQRDFAKQPASD